MQSSWGLILLCPTYLLFVLAKVESSLFCTYLELIPFLHFSSFFACSFDHLFRRKDPSLKSSQKPHLFALIRTYWGFFQFILLKK